MLKPVTALLLLGSLLAAVPTEAAACTREKSILKSPRAGSKEVQAKALNDRGDIVGFADGPDGTYHAILWKRGKTARAVDLGVPPGYVSSEAYGVNDDRVVFGLLYDRRERTFPFRWEDGRMTVLRGPNGRLRQADVPDRNAINQRGEIAATLLVAGQRRAVRWTRRGKATFLPALPGHTWTNAWSIGEDGVVSGWSRKLPDDEGENNPVLWTKSGEVIALKTAPGRADGAAEATNRSGLTVGYLGNLGTETDPPDDHPAVWRTQTEQPQLLERASSDDTYAELVDVNDRGQAAGMSGLFTKTGFPKRSDPAIWQPGWTRLRTLPLPAPARTHRVVITQLHDINARGAIIGNVYGLAARDFGKLQRVYPVLWTCPFAAPASASARQEVRDPLGVGVERQDRQRGLVERLETTLDRVRARVGDPGLQAVLVRNGRVRWSAERGDAILEPRDPVGRSTMFALASFGKLMLSAYALDRVEAGALDLDSRISKYVGGSIPGSKVVTPRMLLAHTAGYPDVYSSFEIGPLFGDQYDPNRVWSFASLAPGIHDPVDPGVRWEYSNTGFIVLARVLDAITEKPLERAYMRFVRTAGLTERRVTMRRSPSALRRLAHGYIASGSGVSDSFAGALGIPTDMYGLPWGDGAFAGTALGAARFLDGLFVRGRLLRSASVLRMTQPTPQSLAAGPEGGMPSYGMGTASYRAAGRVWRGHDGSYGGFTAMGATDLKRGVSIAVVANRQPAGEQPALAIWRALAKAYAERTP